MFISKARHHGVCAEYERKVLELSNQLSQLDFSTEGNGGPYKRILECREAAKIADTLPPAQARQLLFRLSFIDSWLNDLIPLMTRNMRAEHKELWESALSALPAGEIYAEAMYPLPSQGSYRHV